MLPSSSVIPLLRCRCCYWEVQWIVEAKKLQSFWNYYPHQPTAHPPPLSHILTPIDCVTLICVLSPDIITGALCVLMGHSNAGRHTPALILPFSASRRVHIKNTLCRATGLLCMMLCHHFGALTAFEPISRSLHILNCYVSTYNYVPLLLPRKQVISNRTTAHSLWLKNSRHHQPTAPRMNENKWTSLCAILLAVKGMAGDTD